MKRRFVLRVNYVIKLHRKTKVDNTNYLLKKKLKQRTIIKKQRINILFLFFLLLERLGFKKELYYFLLSFFVCFEFLKWYFTEMSMMVFH